MNPKTLLEEFEITPKKALGQNFLHDPNALEKIVTIAELMPEDIVLEVGPGTGNLTRGLARAARRVFAVEIDTRLQPLLDDVLEDCDNVTVIYDDVLKVDVPALVEHREFVVVANVPYYISSAILRHLLDAPHRPRRVVLTVQYELAERVVAQPGDLSLLGVSVQFYGKAQIVARLPPAVFWPRPEIDSAVLCVEVYETPPVDVPDSATFFRVARAGFGQKRKQLKNALSSGLGLNATAAGQLLAAAGIDPMRRAETLTLEQWAALARAYAALYPAQPQHNGAHEQH